MNTTAFQRRRVEFQTPHIKTGGSRFKFIRCRHNRASGCSDRPRREDGCRIPYRGTRQLTLTENTLDLAINGEGYFEVELPDGETAYTVGRFPTKREW